MLLFSFFPHTFIEQNCKVIEPKLINSGN
jgi:hypothetical protein